MRLTEIKTFEELEKIADFVISQTPNLDKAEFLTRAQNMITEESKLTAIFDEENCVALITANIISDLKNGKTLRITDFLSDLTGEKFQNCAKMVINWARETAPKIGCDHISISIKTLNTDLQKAFSQNKFSLNYFGFEG